MPRKLATQILPLLVFAMLAGLWAVHEQTPAAAEGVFAITKQEDTADGHCDADCSLREAIIEANADDNASTIIVPASARNEIPPGTPSGTTGCSQMA